VTDERFAAPPNERARYSSAVANVNLRILQRRSSIMNKDEIGNVKYTRDQLSRDIRQPERESSVQLQTLRT